MNFRDVWKTWHIVGVRNFETFGAGDGERHFMLDGIEELVRPSMRLRALSERKLRQEQLHRGWSNEELLEHVRGDHDDDPTHDDEIYAQLQFLGVENEAPKFIPEAKLRALRVGLDATWPAAHVKVSASGRRRGVGAS